MSILKFWIAIAISALLACGGHLAPKELVDARAAYDRAAASNALKLVPAGNIQVVLLRPMPRLAVAFHAKSCAIVALDHQINPFPRDLHLRGKRVAQY